jgi:hypothetical protein
LYIIKVSLYGILAHGALQTQIVLKIFEGSGPSHGLWLWDFMGLKGNEGLSFYKKLKLQFPQLPLQYIESFF